MQKELHIEPGKAKAIILSIVCVTYNASKTLPQLIESIARHKNSAVEFIVIDGESTDETKKILSTEAAVDFWISEPDDGIYDAMNKALRYVNGKWILYIGADDTLLDDFGKMIGLLKDPAAIYYGNVLFYGKKFSRQYDDYYLTKLNICHSAIFYPVSVFNKYRYEAKYKVYADYHLNLRCWKDKEFKFVHTDLLVSSFADGGFSSYTQDLLFNSERDQLFKTYLKKTSYLRYLNRTLGFAGMIRKIMGMPL